MWKKKRDEIKIVISLTLKISWMDQKCIPSYNCMLYEDILKNALKWKSVVLTNEDMFLAFFNLSYIYFFLLKTRII